MSADCPPGFRLEDGKCVPDIKDRGTPVQCPECFGEAGVDPGDCRWCGGFAAGRAMIPNDKLQVLLDLEARAEKAESALGALQKRIDEAPPVWFTHAFCDDCANTVEAIIEPLHRDALNQGVEWGDIICSVCHGIIVTVSRPLVPVELSGSAAQEDADGP